MQFHKQLRAAKKERDRELLQRHPPSLGLRRTGIAATDPPSPLLRRASRNPPTRTLRRAGIDGLVYKLYGLTEKEIRIVEGVTE